VPAQCTRPWAQQAQALQQRRLQQAKYYDRHTRAFENDLSGCRALLRDGVGPPSVVDVFYPAPAPRAYYVRLPSGQVTIRNRCFLRPLPRLSTATPTVCLPLPSAAVSPGLLPSRPRGSPRPLVRPSGTVSSGVGPLSPASTLPSPARIFPPSVPRRPFSAHPLMMQQQLPSAVASPAAASPGAADVPASPRPSPATASASSSAPGSPAESSGTWASASSARTTPSRSPPPPPSRRPAADPDTAPPGPLGFTRAGRVLFPSLKAQEARDSGQWNPSVIACPRPAPPARRRPGQTARAQPPPSSSPPPGLP
jgi:hypothetical protein